MDWVQLANNYNGAITAGVALAGLIWAVIKFRTRGEHLARIQFDVTAKVIDIHNEHAVVAIKLTLANKGNVPIKINKFYLKVFGFHGDDPFVVFDPREKGPKDSSVDFKHFLHSQNMLESKKSKWFYTFIRPKVVQDYNHVISVPLEMRYIRVRGKFFYNFGKFTPHTAANVIKIEAPQGESEK